MLDILNILSGLKVYIYTQVVMAIHTIFAAVFIWILFNMVSSCAAFGCGNRVKKDSGISFHRFPKKGSELEK